MACGNPCPTANDLQHSLVRYPPLQKIIRETSRQYRVVSARVDLQVSLIFPPLPCVSQMAGN